MGTPHVNKQIRRLTAIFKWAAGQELISISVFQSLKAVEIPQTRSNDGA